MKWKKNVTIEKNKTWNLNLGEEIKAIAEKDIYLVKAVEDGICDDEELIKLVAVEEEIDETAAAFGLAQFLLDYSDFIAEDTERYIII